MRNWIERLLGVTVIYSRWMSYVYYYLKMSSMSKFMTRNVNLDSCSLSKSGCAIIVHQHEETWLFIQKTRTGIRTDFRIWNGYLYRQPSQILNGKQLSNQTFNQLMFSLTFSSCACKKTAVITYNTCSVEQFISNSINSDLHIVSTDAF